MKRTTKQKQSTWITKLLFFVLKSHYVNVRRAKQTAVLHEIQLNDKELDRYFAALMRFTQHVAQRTKRKMPFRLEQ